MFDLAVEVLATGEHTVAVTIVTFIGQACKQNRPEIVCALTRLVLGVEADHPAGFVIPVAAGRRRGGSCDLGAVGVVHLPAVPVEVGQ